MTTCNPRGENQFEVRIFSFTIENDHKRIYQKKIIWAIPKNN